MGDWPALQLMVIFLCVILHVAERWARIRLPRLRDRLDIRWGAISEGVVLGAVLALAVAAGGVGSEFIYFQF